MIIRNDKGFTLLEMLFSLTVFVVISGLAVQLFFIMGTELKTNNQVDPMEWEMFINEVKSEVRESTDQKIVSNTVSLIIENNVVTIEKYQNMLRRRVNGSGHQVLLQNISSYEASWEGRALVIAVTDQSGMSYRRILQPYVVRGL